MRTLMILPVLLAIGCAAPSADDDTASSSEAFSTSSSKVTTHDQCTDDDHADFQVRYENKSLPWGTRVVLHSGYGFYEGPPYDWLDVRDDDAKPSGAWTWTAVRHVDWHGAAAGPRRLDFAIEIILPDGKVVWDSNKRENYYYMAEASNVCDGAWHDSPMFNPVP